MSLHVGDILSSRFRIVSQLGQGGFGAVYRAWDLRLNGPCAIKENLDISPAGQKQFAREASLLFNLRHPNLPRVFDTFVVEGQGQYLVMDFIEGEDLQSLLDRTGGPLPVGKVLAWMQQVCDALIYLHSQQPPVIHRDIKPANIRITPAGQAVLVDFGIAKVYDPHLKTTLGAQAVTPGYSPPEQYGSGRTDERSDVYSLGATMYTLLTGVVLPASVDIYAGLASPPRQANQVNPAIPVQVSAALEKAMQPNRTARLNAATEFRDALSLGDAGDARVTAVISPRALAASQQDAAVAASQASNEPAASGVASAPPAALDSSPAVPVEPSQPAVGRRRKVWVAGLLLACLLFLIIGAGAFILRMGHISRVGSRSAQPGIEAPDAMAMSGDIRLLHTYESGGIEAELLHQAIVFLQDRFPELHVRIESVPMEDLWGFYPEAVAAGEGPDLLWAPNDQLGAWAREGLVLRLDEHIRDRPADMDKVNLVGMQVDGGIYGLPNSAKAVALYYNRKMIDRPPENTEELVGMVGEGVPMVNILNAYHLFGWGAAFGGNLIDDQGRCVANRTGWIDALHYLRGLRESGAIFDPDYESMEAAFLRGDAAMIVNGPWALIHYQEHLGEALGVALMPSGPQGPARPLTGYDGFYINPQGDNIPTAVNLAFYLTSRVVAQRYTNIARQIPARHDLEIEEPMMAVFLEAANMGFPYMHLAEFDNYWGPFDEAFVLVILEGVPPEDALAEACARMNEANQH